MGPTPQALACCLPACIGSGPVASGQSPQCRRSAGSHSPAHPVTAFNSAELSWSRQASDRRDHATVRAHAAASGRYGRSGTRGLYARQNWALQAVGEEGDAAAVRWAPVVSGSGTACQRPMLGRAPIGEMDGKFKGVLHFLHASLPSLALFACY